MRSAIEICPLDEFADRRAIVCLARAAGVIVAIGPDGTSMESSARAMGSRAALLADISPLVRAGPPRATS